MSVDVQFKKMNKYIKGSALYSLEPGVICQLASLRTTRLIKYLQNLEMSENYGNGGERVSGGKSGIHYHLGPDGSDLSFLYGYRIFFKLNYRSRIFGWISGTYRILDIR